MAAAFSSVALASLAFTTYTLWLTTPGYNLVVLIAAVVVAGMTASLALTPLISASEGREEHSQWPIEVALGVVLSIILATKAPSFVIIGLLSTLAIVATRGLRRWLRHLLRLAMGVGVGLLVLIILTGSPWDVARRMTRGIHANGLLGGHTSESLWETTAMRHVYGPWFLRFLFGAVALRVLWKLVHRDGARLVLTAVGSLVTAAVFGRSLPGGGSASFVASGWWWVRLAAMMLLWSTASVGVVSRKLAVGPLVVLMAVGAAAGSNNGVIREVALYVGILGVGLLVHGFVVVSLREEAHENGGASHATRTAAALLPIGMFFVVGSLASNGSLQGALHSPYRLNGTLSSESEPVDLGAFGTIKVHPETARYIRELQAIGSRVPDGARDCLVDLAGGTPLSAIALGIRPAGAPWIIGGYPGSDEFADYVLTGSPCLSGPFVLIEAPLGSRAVGRPAWLDMHGATLLGKAQYHGYLTEEQLVWLMPPAEGAGSDPPGN